MTRSFWQTLPPRPLFFLLAAAFFTFGTWGFVDDMRTFGARSYSQLAYVVVLSGLIAALYAWSAMRARRLLPLVVLFHVLAFPSESLAPSGEPVLPQLPAQVQALRERFTLDSAGIVAFIVVGYAFFIRLAAYEGVAHLRAQKEIALAQEIHKSLVPAFHERRGHFEVCGHSRASGEVGGDLVDVVGTSDGWTALVADVSGHGVASGLLMGMVKSALRMKLLSSDALDALLDDLDRVVGQIRSPEMFVTIAALRFDGTQTAELGLAGHLPILHYRHAADSIESIENAHPPLGVVDGQRHGSRRVEFGGGDLFVLLTDGLTEVTNLRGELFGTHGVEDVLRRHAREPLATIYASLLAAVRAHGPQTDDQTLLLVRTR